MLTYQFVLDASEQALQTTMAPGLLEAAPIWLLS